MSGRDWTGIAVVGVLLLLVGCLPLRVKEFLDGGPEGELLVGPADGMSLTAQATLSRMGLYAQTNRDGDTIRIDSATRSGRKFRLLLTRAERDGLAHTRVRVVWEAEADAAFWAEFLVALRNPEMPANNDKLKNEAQK